MSFPLQFTQVPSQLSNVTGHLTPNQDGSFTASVTFAPGGGAQGRLASGTDVAIIIDASFSMFAGFYRSAKVLDFVDAVASFLTPYDDDGVDVYLHSLREAPFRHLGAFRVASDVSAQLGEYMEAGSAMKAMGQKTLCTPALRDVVRRLKEEKGSERLFVEIITDGAFDDKEELEAALVEFGNRYNTPEHTMGFRVHFTGIGPGGAKAVEFLQQLDDQLEARHPGFIDCVDFDAANEVQQNIASIVKELKHAVRLEVDNAIVMVQAADGGQPSHICDPHVGDWQEGGVLSFEGLPAEVTIHAVFPSRPSGLRLDLTYIESATGESRELSLAATI